MSEIIDIAKGLRPRESTTAGWLEQEERPHAEEKPYERAKIGDTVEHELPVTDGDLQIESTTKVDKNFKVKRFLEMVEGGKKPWDAAKQMGTTCDTLYKQAGIKAAVKKLIEANTLPAGIRKEMVRASLNQILMQNLDNPKGHKLALGAAKLISQDPDVGLNIPPTSVSVNIDVGKLNQIFENTKTPDGLEILEGEFEDVGDETKV